MNEKHNNLGRPAYQRIHAAERAARRKSEERQRRMRRLIEQENIEPPKRNSTEHRIAVIDVILARRDENRRAGVRQQWPSPCPNCGKPWYGNTRCTECLQEIRAGLLKNGKP